MKKLLILSTTLLLSGCQLLFNGSEVRDIPTKQFSYHSIAVDKEDPRYFRLTFWSDRDLRQPLYKDIRNMQCYVKDKPKITKRDWTHSKEAMYALTDKNSVKPYNNGFLYTTSFTYSEEFIIHSKEEEEKFIDASCGCSTYEDHSLHAQHIREKIIKQLQPADKQLTCSFMHVPFFSMFIYISSPMIIPKQDLLRVFEEQKQLHRVTE
ncbi:hypothetical protein [Phocoenobacter atlanticus]|uniref:hypothetical protein n=1 Tax=Phocoenobacter atlanticus TaxID=3416742 RepID=UPI0027575E1F|nr:hypothetical protein [Pasteurella atlantica]MDP8100842.1 hypothetical protein [Pasteurella atlantica]